MDNLREQWASHSQEASFFFKVRHIPRLCKHRVREYRKEELDIRAKLEATTRLHDDVYNVNIQGEVSEPKRLIEDIKTRKAMVATIRSRVKWKQVGNKGSIEFFKSFMQENAKVVYQNLRITRGKVLPRGRILIEFVKTFTRNFTCTKTFMTTH